MATECPLGTGVAAVAQAGPGLLQHRRTQHYLCISTNLLNPADKNYRKDIGTEAFAALLLEHLNLLQGPVLLLCGGGLQLPFAAAASAGLLWLPDNCRFTVCSHSKPPA